MKKKFFKKDRKIKKSKTPKNAKKLVKAKKAARKFVVSPESTPLGIKQLREAHPDAEIVTLGFEAQPETLADRADEAHEPIPGDVTEAV